MLLARMSDLVSSSLWTGLGALAALRVRPGRDVEETGFGWGAWVEGRADLWRAILGSSLVVVLGFGLLLLSAFPPSRRLGLAVVVGSVAAVAAVLLVLPRLAVGLGRSGG